MVDRLKVRLAFVILARVDHLAKGKDDELIEHGDDVAARLVDCEDDSALVVACKGDETFDHIEGVICVKATGGFVQEEYGGTGDKLAGDRYATLLAARDRAVP